MIICSVCLVPVSSSIWDEYLDNDETSSSDVLMVEEEEEREPLFLAQPTIQNCDRANLKEMLSHTDYQIQTATEIFRRKTIQFCKETFEKDMIDLLGRLDDGLKGRVSKLIESIVQANKNKDFEGAKLAMPDRSTSEGILIAMEQNGVDLSTIKSRVEFNTKYNAIVDDCNEVEMRLINIAHSYLVFFDQNNNKIAVQLDPVVAQWTKNAIVCEKLAINPLYGFNAFRLLQERSAPIEVKTDKKDAPKNGPNKGDNNNKGSRFRFPTIRLG